MARPKWPSTSPFPYIKATASTVNLSHYLCVFFYILYIVVVVNIYVRDKVPKKIW